MHRPNRWTRTSPKSSPNRSAHPAPSPDPYGRCSRQYQPLLTCFCQRKSRKGHAEESEPISTRVARAIRKKANQSAQESQGPRGRKQANQHKSRKGHAEESKPISATARATRKTSRSRSRSKVAGGLAGAIPHPREKISLTIFCIIKKHCAIAQLQVLTINERRHLPTPETAGQRTVTAVVGP